MDLKGKQIFRIGNAAGFGFETGNTNNKKKRNKIVNLLRKINRHIELIGEKIKWWFLENKASFPEF